MAMESPLPGASTSSRDLDAGPPRPPKPGGSILQLGNNPLGAPGLGMEAADPSVRILQKLQESRNKLMELAALLPPPHSDAVQQLTTALMTAVPQMMADMVSGQVPLQGPPGQGPPVSQAPTAPPPAGAPGAAPGGPGGPVG